MEEKIIAFLEYYIKEENIKKELDKDLEHGHLINYELLITDVIKYAFVDDHNQVREKEENVSSWLAQKLRFHYNKSLKLLRDIYVNNPQEIVYREFLLICNRLQVFLEDNTVGIERYPVLLLPIRGIINKINRELRVLNWKDYILDESSLKIDSEIQGDIDEQLMEKTPEYLIEEIFGFFKGKNQEGETILSPEDYKLLQLYLTELVINQNLPKVTKRLSPKLPKGITSFSVWVLHKELYPSYFRISKMYLEFLRAVFTIYEDTTELSSIKSQFGVRSRVSRHSYLPEIIINHL